MKLVFMGSPAFAVPALEALAERHEVALVVTQPDKPVGRGLEVQSPPVAELAKKRGLPLFQPKSARTPEFVEALKKTGAEVAVVVAYGKILPVAVLEALPRGCLNIHASLLPAYRGAAPIQWALIRGERETGITIMQLDAGMDTGPMLLKQSLEISADDTYGSLSEKLAPMGAKLILEALEMRPKPEAQDESQASYAPLLKKSDGFIDWAKDAPAIANLTRGVDPWPGATAVLPSGILCKLFGARPAGEAGPPGEVVAIDKRGVVVACGRGAVGFKDIQAAGKKRMPAADFARGGALQKGMVLGSAST
jgi:methionyl-tRNA formyltransferase